MRPQEDGINPNHMNWRHVTLLHDMAQDADLAKTRLLLDHGASIDAVGEGTVPLRSGLPRVGETVLRTRLSD